MSAIKRLFNRRDFIECMELILVSATMSLIGGIIAVSILNVLSD